MQSFSSLAGDGRNFKVINNHDKNIAAGTIEARLAQVTASMSRYLVALDRADREPSGITEARTARINEKIAGLREGRLTASASPVAHPTYAASGYAPRSRRGATVDNSPSGSLP